MTDQERELHNLFNAISYTEDQIIEYKTYLKELEEAAEKDELDIIITKDNLRSLEAELERLTARREDLSMEWWKDNMHPFKA